MSILLLLFFLLSKKMFSQYFPPFQVNVVYNTAQQFASLFFLSNVIENQCSETSSKQHETSLKIKHEEPIFQKRGIFDEIFYEEFLQSETDLFATKMIKEDEPAVIQSAPLVSLLPDSPNSSIQEEEEKQEDAEINIITAKNKIPSRILECQDLYCGYKSNNKSHFEKHLKMHTIPEKRIIQCPDCLYKGVSLSEMTYHKNRKH